jgi:hypothetical protein
MCVGLTTFPLLSAEFLETWKPPPPGTLRRVQGLFDLLYIVLKCNKKYIKTAADS